jgi:hypothetical protein
MLQQHPAPHELDPLGLDPPRIETNAGGASQQTAQRTAADHEELAAIHHGPR